MSRTVARAAAVQAALARGDDAAMQRQLDALALDVMPLRTLLPPPNVALAKRRPADALAALDAPAARRCRRAAWRLRAQALAALGRAHEAYGLLGALRQQQALPAAHLSELEARWAAASLREAADANVLADRWEALPKPLRNDPAVGRRLCRARRRAALGRSGGEKHRAGARHALGRIAGRSLRPPADRPARIAPRQCRALAAGASRPAPRCW